MELNRISVRVGLVHINIAALHCDREGVGRCVKRVGHRSILVRLIADIGAGIHIIHLIVEHCRGESRKTLAMVGQRGEVGSVRHMVTDRIEVTVVREEKGILAGHPNRQGSLAFIVECGGDRRAVRPPLRLGEGIGDIHHICVEILVKPCDRFSVHFQVRQLARERELDMVEVLVRRIGGIISATDRHRQHIARRVILLGGCRSRGKPVLHLGGGICRWIEIIKLQGGERIHIRTVHLQACQQ